MYTWVIYDISKDRVRRQIAVRCRQLGLRRVQKSVFLGTLKKKARRHFLKEARNLINRRTDVLFLVPMSTSQYERVVQLGQGFDPAQLRRLSTRFF